MSHTITPQHPAVVLRSAYTQLRTLLLIAMVAVVGLSTAVVILATGDDNSGSQLTANQQRAVTAFGSLSAAQLDAALRSAGSVRYDGGPDEGTRGPQSYAVPDVQKPVDGSRYDGGPEEGTRGPQSDDTSQAGEALRKRSEGLNRIYGLN